MNTIESNYINSKGNGPYYDKIVKNNFGEVFFMFLEDLTEEKRQYSLDKTHFNTAYSKAQLITVGKNQFKKTIWTKGRNNASAILMLGERKKIIMINILPEYRTAHITPTRKVRQILETISVEENNIR
ncbi:MAG: hypothetical protein CR972_05005 [Candidatus Moraniibacteriota bacterium]|nr:MAG: hypothetical protein CR972_05005 [Candidatus Moranbacteria bacterium]